MAIEQSTHESVASHVSHYFRSLDERRFDTEWGEAFFTADARTHAPVGAAQGTAAIVERTKVALGRFDRTQHMSTDVLTRPAPDGESAEASWNALMTHIHHDGRLFTVGGRFQATLLRTENGWRFDTLSIAPVWTDGEPPDLGNGGSAPAAG